MRMRKCDNNAEKRTGLFWKTLTSYYLILLLPILICAFYYIHSFQVLKERTEANQQLLLDNLSEQINAVFQDTINLGYHLRLNKYVVALADGKSTPDSNTILDRYYLQEDLATLQASNTLIQKISLYFCISDYVVDTNSAYQMDLLASMDSRNDALRAEDWNLIFQELESNRLICYTKEGGSFLAIIETLLTDSESDISVILCTQIDKSAFLSRLENQILPDASSLFALINANGLLLAADDAGDSFSDLLSSLSFEQISELLTESDGNYEYTLETGQKVLLNRSLLISETALVLMPEKSFYNTQMTQLLQIMILTMALCLMIGSVIIYYYARKSYEPVSEIMHFIKKTSNDNTTEKNEYRLIMRTLTHNYSELGRQRKLLKNNYTQKILSGEILFEQIPEHVAEQFSLQFSSPYVCVVTFLPQDLNSDGALNAELASFIIQNVYQELLFPVFPETSFIPDGNTLSVLVSTPADSFSHLEQETEKLTHFCERTFCLSVKAGISGMNRIEDIPTASFQAKTALRYLSLFESGSVCCYDKIPQKNSIGFIPFNSMEYVTQLITSGTQSEINEYFEMIEKNIGKSVLTWTDAQSCYYFFYHAAAKLQLYCQLHFDLQTESLNFADDAFFSKPILSALLIAKKAFLLANQEIISQKQKEQTDSWGKDICRFIENNYFDSSMNLNMIAEHFHLSPSYLSKKFREQYQKSVVDYLYDIRIDHATALLLEPDLRITDVARMVGFVDSNAFIRIFKKWKGTTPGKWKDSNLVS